MVLSKLHKRIRVSLKIYGKKKVRTHVYSPLSWVLPTMDVFTLLFVDVMSLIFIFLFFKASAVSIGVCLLVMLVALKVEFNG